ncbi:MAG: DUF4184 family protein [Candidatus Hermodarchaeota archaeon]
MPSSIFSHQAPGLLIKIRYPRKFDGTALCLGALIPDFNFILDFFLNINFYLFTHSLIGQFLWTIPLTIFATVIFSQYIGPLCARIASKNSKFYTPLRYYGVDQWNYLKKKKYSRKSWLIISYSALIGGITHILLDFPAHKYITILFPWFVGLNFEIFQYSFLDYGTISVGPFSFEANLTLYNFLWFIETIVAFVISLYLLRYIKKHNLIKKWYEILEKE